MNARQAIFESEKLTNEMLEDAKRMSLRLNISTDQALDKLNSMYQRYAKTANEKAAWDIRTKNAKEKDERTPSEKKIASIRKEIAILVNEQGIGIGEARKQMNIKYGKGWRERGLSSNPDDQWPAEDLQPYLQ